MTIQTSVAFRNASLDLTTSQLGAGWKLNLRAGAQPANVATASTGAIVATYTPAAASAANGSKVMVTATPLSTPALAANAGGAMHYELTTSADVVVERGKVGATGDGTADMLVDNLTIALNQAVQITGFTKTAPGA